MSKGYNTKRRHAQRGRADTMVCDLKGWAVCFTSGEPGGLTTTLPGALTQLRTITGPTTKIMLGFDRGGAYPSVVAGRAVHAAATGSPTGAPRWSRPSTCP